MQDGRILEALWTINPAGLDYDEWLKVGMALHKEGFDCADWDKWSAQDSARYKEGDCERRWKGFGVTNTAEVTAGTLVDIAKRYGFETYDDELLDWNAVIDTDWEPDSEGILVKDKAWLDTEASENQLIESKVGWNDTGNIDEAIRYIEALFKPDDYVGFVYESYYKEKEDKWSPKNHGVSIKAADLLADLRKAKDKDGDITRAIFTYKKEAGVWIRPNPLNGQGYGNKDVTAFRYALIESDKMDVSQQIAIIRELQIPVKMLVYSGGKSVHAIVKINAANEKEYRQRVDRLYAECKRNRFIVDEQNKNASRLSRLPGVWRNGKKQYIIDEDIGKETWQEWLDFLEEIKDTLPEIENLDTAIKEPHDLTPELIEGTLRQGHKMLIAGPSKAGKSFLLMELAAAISTGGEWLGKRCKKGRVLYLNLEIDKNSFITRFEEIYKTMDIDMENAEKISFLSLRGKSEALDKLAPMIIRRVRGQELAAIILDPIYKVITGDENNARDMSNFCNQFDRIATETGAAMIYVHHHSKGSQIGKRSMDRASGSGVFARDPDALIDMVELAPDKRDGNMTAWRLEATLREFKAWPPMNIWFDFPVHRLDEDGVLDHRTVFDPLTMVNEAKSEMKEGSKSDAIRSYEELKEWDTDGTVLIEDIAAAIGKTARTVRGYFQEMEDDFEIISIGGKGSKAKARVRRRDFEESY
jgi:RecA-family ATPase